MTWIDFMVFHLKCGTLAVCTGVVSNKNKHNNMMKGATAQLSIYSYIYIYTEVLAVVLLLGSAASTEIGAISCSAFSLHVSSP